MPAKDLAPRAQLPDRRARWRGIWRVLALAGAACVGLALAGELAVRASGATDFPVYAVDPAIGYYPLPNQSGSFLHFNRWFFNDRSLGVERPWNPDGRINVLLIGNSVVIGGNPYDQQDRLATLLQKRLGDRYAVWPVAAGGWNAVNELRFLERHPELVAAADFFVWEYGTEGFVAPTAWPGETLRPTHPPRSALLYVIGKYLLGPLGLAAPPAPAPVERRHDDYAQFVAMIGRLSAASARTPPGIVWLYPERASLRDIPRGVPWPADRARIERLADEHRLEVVDFTREPRWTPGLYKDPIHPTLEGNRVAAELLAAAIGRVLQAGPTLAPAKSAPRG
jgi:hypothetical protein